MTSPESSQAATGGPDAAASLRTRIDLELWIFLCLIVLANTVFVSAIKYAGVPWWLFSSGRFYVLGGILVSVVFLFRGKQAVLDLGRPILKVKVNPLWYLFALSWGPLMCTIALAIKSAYLGQNAILPSLTDITNKGVFRSVFVAAFVGEIVWVGYAISRMMGRRTPFEAALIVGCFWTAWWVPIVWLGQGVIPGLPLGPLFINMLGVAGMCSFVYCRTKSGFVVLVLQLTFNSSLLIFPVVPTTGGEATYTLFSFVYALASLGMFLVFGPKPLFSKKASA
ncbi:MAG: hypothetical protein JNK82_04000 [Myxococcaceae bacterium]|nr:hypothetical protein [Myxococcaceae bacterium]